MNPFGQYKSSLKPIEIRELHGLLLFKPIAFVFTKVFCHTPVTPNQISIISLFLGIVAGVVVAFGTLISIMAGGLLFIFSAAPGYNSGKLFRSKKNEIKVERMVDGAVACFACIVFYIGLAIGLSKLVTSNQIYLPMNPWILALIMNLAHALHAIITDYYPNKYEGQVFGKYLYPKSQIVEFDEEKLKLGKREGKGVEKLILNGHIKYCKMQASRAAANPIKYTPESCARNSFLLVFLWNIIGPAMHAFMLGLLLILVNPMMFLWLAVVFANIWMLLLFASQEHFDDKLVLVEELKDRLLPIYNRY